MRWVFRPVAREYPREVTLIGKPNTECDFGERPVRAADQLRCRRHTPVLQIAVRRHSNTLSERTRKVTGGKSCYDRKFTQAYLVR